MPRSTNRFNQREISRALRAARRAGESVERVELDPATGKIAVILAKPGADDASKNPWDEVYDGPNEKRPA